MIQHRSRRSRRRGQAGMALMECLVAMLIFSVGILGLLGLEAKAINFSVDAEDRNRASVLANEIASNMWLNNTVNVRGAGSAIAESAYPTDRGVLGCKLNASSIFPRTTAFPYPFGNFLAGVTNTLTVAPVLIGQGQSQNGSDVIAVMGGSGAAGGVSRQISGGGSATTMSLDNTVGFLPNDVALVSQSGVVDCLLEEVASVAAPVLNVGGTTYYTATGTTTNLATLTANTLSYVTPIGNAAANNIQFMLFGVDSNRRLYSYDLLQNLNFVNGVGTDVAQAFADGVVQMNAIYGIDTNGDGIQDNWAGPGVPSSDAAWNITNVMANPSLMREIVSIRIALVVRGEYYDKNVVTPATLTLFNGLTNSAAAPLTQVINLAPTDQHYRYRIFEFTVPLRNMLLLAGVS